MDTHQFLLNNGYNTDDPDFGRIAQRAHNLINNDGVKPRKALKLIKNELGEPNKKLELADQPKPITIYGEVGTDIDQTAYDQLDKACRLPVAIAGSLLPDAIRGTRCRWAAFVPSKMRYRLHLLALILPAA